MYAWLKLLVAVCFYISALLNACFVVHVIILIPLRLFVYNFITQLP